MNEQERQLLLNRLQALLSEHCNGYIVTVEVECEDGSTTTLTTWGGGFNMACGLVERTRNRMRESDTETNTPPPGDDDGEDWKRIPQ